VDVAGSKKEEEEEEEERNCTMKNLVLLFIIKYYPGDQIKNDVMGRACTANDRDKKHMQDFGWKKPLSGLRLFVVTVLKCMTNKWLETVPRIGTSGRVLLTRD
jgi:hypothetical protein